LDINTSLAFTIITPKQISQPLNSVITISPYTNIATVGGIDRSYLNGVLGFHINQKLLEIGVNSVSEMLAVLRQKMVLFIHVAAGYDVLNELFHCPSLA
jgi:hypothetical protein